MKFVFLLFSFVSLFVTSTAFGDQVECIKYVRGEYPYPSAADAAKICKGANVDCIKYIRGEYPFQR